jgi:hypothetical protein
LDRLTVHNAAHRFIASRSMQTNALFVAGADVVVKVDIKDFFPSITFPPVRGLLRHAGLTEQVATVVALLRTESPMKSSPSTATVSATPCTWPPATESCPGFVGASSKSSPPWVIDFVSLGRPSPSPRS